MKINNFWGELTDISAENVPLAVTVTSDAVTACGGAERFAEMIRALQALTDALVGSEAVADLFRALHTTASFRAETSVRSPR